MKHNFYRSFLLLIFFVFKANAHAQEQKNCEELRFFSGGMGDGKLQWFAPIEHLVSKDTLSINLRVDDLKNKDQGYFIIKSVDWNWDCEKSTGIITLNAIRKVIDVENPLDIKFSEALYVVDFSDEDSKITLKYEDDPTIYFSDIKIKERDPITIY